MSSLSESIYTASPIWAQQIMVAAYGSWWYRRRFGRQFHRLVAELRERDHWTLEQMRRFQAEKLAALLETARRSVYYGQVFRERGLTPGMDPWEALACLPLLTKETLRTRPKDLLVTQAVPKGTLVFKSSGTTGTPTDIYYPPSFHALELAVPEVRNLNWAGLTYKDRRVMFGVRKVCRYEQDRPPFWRFSPRENMAYASIYHLSPQYLKQYIRFLKEYRPAMIMGYPSALNVIAKYALDNNDYPAPANAIFTTSETVTASIRENLETAWKCTVYDRYGAVENCLFASQCEHGRYHVSPDVGILEILDAAGNPCPPGVLGEVICTGLHNTLQPLIRYRLGDVARWSAETSCPCGRDWPILEGIEGRFEDICTTPDGRKVLRFDTVFKGIESIKEAQVIQEDRNRFLIKVVPGADYSAGDTEILKNNMKKHVGNVEVVVQPVGSIPRASSGKFRAVICNLDYESRAN